MGRARLEFLSRDEEDLIHGQSVRCLEELGILIRSSSVLKMLEDAGASVDYDRQIAHIPEDMVNEAVKKAPRKLTLCARDPKYDMSIPVDGIPYMGTTGLAIYMTDLDTEERRNATRSDLADFARLADAIDSVDFFGDPVNTASKLGEDLAIKAETLVTNRAIEHSSYKIPELAERMTGDTPDERFQQLIDWLRFIQGLEQPLELFFLLTHLFGL